MYTGQCNPLHLPENDQYECFQLNSKGRNVHKFFKTRPSSAFNSSDNFATIDYPGWKSTAVHRWSPMFHQSPTGGRLRWHPQILRWPPVDHRWTTDGGTHSTTGGPPKIPPVVTVVPPVVTDCSTEGTMMMQVQQKSAEI